jgi:hypothetical protein
MVGHDQFLVSGNYFFYFPFTLFSLLFTIFYSYVLFARHFVEGGGQRQVLMEVLTALEQAAPKQAPPEQPPPTDD